MTDTPTGIYGLLGALIDDGVDPDDAASRIVRRRDIRDLVLPLVAEEARHTARSRTRTIEQRVDRLLAVSPDARCEARRTLVDERFILPDGRFVAWLDATADDHRQRAGWLRRQARAVEQTACRHELAAAEIEAAGVSCLRELEVAA